MTTHTHRKKVIDNKTVVDGNGVTSMILITCHHNP